MSDEWTIDISLVKLLAKSARLDLTDEELIRYTEQLKVILDAFKTLDEVDTENVKPSFHPVEIKSVLREDKAEDWDWDPFGNSIHKEQKRFRGPKIA